MIAMTRINLVPPTELSRQHLVAEYRELPRIFGLVRAAQAKGKTPSTISQPNSYVLGTGHMLFFYDKLWFLTVRQQSLIDEMKQRGYKPQHTDALELGDGLHNHWFNDYTPTPEAIALNRARIKERTSEK